MTKFMDSTLHRFVDQELTAEERIAFVARLGRDADLRERAIALETITLEASRLPRPMVPERFVAGVMDRLDPAPSAWRALLDVAFKPRALQWNLAGAAGVACLVVLAAWGAAGALRSRPAAPVAPQVATAGSSERPVQVLVRLVVLQPGAKSVQVAGDFNGWNPARTSLEQTSNGAWTVTLPLTPGRYEYQFVVDGQTWMADPFATELSDDGFGSRNAVIDVRPPLTGAEATL